MALHINAQNDLNEMFDKFATVPTGKPAKQEADLKKKQDDPTAKAATEPKASK